LKKLLHHQNIPSGNHLAYSIFLSDDANTAKTSLDYFNKILDDPKNNHYRLVFNLLSRSLITSNIELKRQQFTTIIRGADERKFGELLARHRKDNSCSTLNLHITSRLIPGVRKG